AGAGSGARRGPAAFGEIAAASPGRLEVQSSTAQTTVTYSKTTRFSQTVKAVLAVGDCVTATGTPASGSARGLTATTVRVISVSGGNCLVAGDGGRAGRAGGPPSGS